MTDLSRLISDLCDGLDDPPKRSVSGEPEIVSSFAIRQPTDEKRSFRSFRDFRSENDTPKPNVIDGANDRNLSASASARERPYVLAPERPERPENDGFVPLAEGLSLFPVEGSEPERPEREDGFCGSPFLDPNRAAPQRSDWWTGPAMAEADRAIPPPADPLPISPADVRAGVARELRALADDGREGPDALRDAVEITRAKIRNAPALAERQAHDGLCHACREPLDDARPVVAMLQPKGCGHLWMHSGACHDAHSRRRAEMVDAIMRSAGFGAETTGEAA